MVIPPDPKVDRSAPAPAGNGRGYAWSAVLIGSRLPEIVSGQFGLVAERWLPFSQTIILLGLALAAAKLRPIKNLAGFILAIAALKFSWDVVVPWLEGSSVIQAAAQHLNWGGRFFLSRAIRTIGAVLMIFTLFGSGIRRRDLFLAVGNWRAPVQREGFFFRRGITWTRLTAVLLLIFGVVLPLFLFLTLRPDIGRMHVLLPLLPLAVATSALNAANEEFQLRSVLLARLKGVVSLREAAFLAGVLFGLDHYFGQPSGWGGVLLAGIGGWIWAKSMIETRGFTCAFASHFVQDLVIFGFLALSAAP